jgi:hypothetical protein
MTSLMRKLKFRFGHDSPESTIWAVVKHLAEIAQRQKLYSPNPDESNHHIFTFYCPNEGERVRVTRTFESACKTYCRSVPRFGHA